MKQRKRERRRKKRSWSKRELKEEKIRELKRKTGSKRGINWGRERRKAGIKGDERKSDLQ